MPRSILKNGSTPNTSIIPAPSREDRNRQTALYHAQLLQQRKDTENLILASTELLLDLPSSADADPARPRAEDTALAKKSLRLFRPPDYDSLIEERNINKKCGYVFCPKQNRQEDTKAKYRILPSKGKGLDTLNIVERHALERWCSDACGKRALYIKVQLNEDPAWTRVESSRGDTLLLEDGQKGQETQEDLTSIEKVKSLDMSLEKDELITNLKALAIERGDEKARSAKLGLLEIDVRENSNLDGRASSPGSSTKNEFDSGYGSIEGYTPNFPGKKSRESRSGNDECEDVIPTL